ncbi:MAG: coenzyme F420-reducing hydrogenase, FrhD protein [Methanomicrobiales archaeon]|jgi:coenzyme F420 hydrogenase subunit delta|nr:coenzyme F420-reducing hydrogenase, FrhD protein [Methanomicrobiales archaeon]
MLFEEIVVCGCGNPLYADDGFGPAVVEEIKEKFSDSIPAGVKIIDAGLGAPHFLFNLIGDSDEVSVKRIIIIDIADFGGTPGQLALLDVNDLPPGAYRDVHSWDLTEPLHRLKSTIDITIIGCQPKRVTKPDFEIGLTDEVEAAIPKAISTLFELLGVNHGTWRASI